MNAQLRLCQRTKFGLSRIGVIGRIEQGRIVPVSVSKELAPPEPWSPWLGAASARQRGAPRAVTKTAKAVAAGSRF